MLPPLYTLPKPSWVTVGPFMGTILEPGSLFSTAAHHLESCHTPEGTILDTTTIPHIVHKDLCLTYWTDRSALIGERTVEGIVWYPHPFTFTNPILEIPRRRLSTTPRKLMVSIVNQTLTVTGPTDLKKVWTKTLNEAIDTWATHLTPIPQTGHPDTGLVCPCYPFTPLTPEEKDTLTTFFIDCFTILGNQHPTSISIRGFKPIRGEWKRPSVDLGTKTHLGCDHKQGLTWIAALLKHPDFPIPTHRLLQRPEDEHPLVFFQMPAASAHAKLEAYTRLTGTLGAFTPPPT